MRQALRRYVRSSPEGVEDVVAHCSFADAVSIPERHYQAIERRHETDRPVYLPLYYQYIVKRRRYPGLWLDKVSPARA